MTFCIGIKVRQGIVMLADTQIVRGSEQVNKAKLAVSRHRDASLFTMTSGLRSIRDKTVIYLDEQLVVSEDLDRLYQVANLFGEQLRRVRAEDGAALQQANFSFNLHAIIGGCLAGDTEPTLFYIYPEGNWIEAAVDSPYFIIGRTPYGKPILDRLLSYETDLETATALALLAFDATRASVTDVDCPIDVGIVFAASRRSVWRRFEAEDVEPVTTWWADRLALALREIPTDWSAALFSPEAEG
ncbi:MAG: proteasome-type protease [Planctomycetaceae bacterium]